MALVKLSEILKDAQKRKYAVGGFDSWNLESIKAIANSADKCDSPAVILAEVPEIDFVGMDYYISIAKMAAEKARVPIAIQYNETSDFNLAIKAIKSGFNSVMIENNEYTLNKYSNLVQRIVEIAHSVDVDVEAEVGEMPEGWGAEIKKEGIIVNADMAAKFVNDTNIDALSVPFGNVHGLRDKKADIDLEILKSFRDKLKIPLVAHGGTGISEDNIKKIISIGICMIKVGTSLRVAYQTGMPIIEEENIGYFPPLIKSLYIGQRKLEQEIERLMHLYGSYNKA